MPVTPFGHPTGAIRRTTCGGLLLTGVLANGDRYGQMVQRPEGLRVYPADERRPRCFRPHLRCRAGRHGWPQRRPTAELRARAGPARPGLGGQPASDLTVGRQKGRRGAPFLNLDWELLIA